MENMIKVPMKSNLLFGCVTLYLTCITFRPNSDSKSYSEYYFRIHNFLENIIKLLTTHPAI